MSDALKNIAIVGANLAGGYAAGALRKQGYDGAITLIGEEPDPPYERPPLSKEMLVHPDVTPKTLFVHPLSFYTEHNITLRLGVRAEALDLSGKAVTLADGSRIAADRIILCTGGHARRLNIPGGDLGNVHVLRNLSDSRAIAAHLSPGKNVVVIGGGVIGLEVAASARMRGCEVAVIEAAPRLMSRVVTPEISAFLELAHRAKGCVMHIGVGVQSLHGANGIVRAVESTSGVQLAADLVVVGVGIDPAIELAKGAGINCGNGIVVDEFCRTSVPEVLAAGDVANQPNPYLNRRARLENVQNAQNQGAAAAASLLGAGEPYAELPYFWSDQFEYMLQAAGETVICDQAILRGSVESGAFSVFYLTAGVVTGVLAVSQPKNIAAGRRMVMKHSQPDPAALADESSDLRKLIG
ncbi:MAG: NAD(P)/FAD-dependent oxidoreductase [Alphaproteobacteria bacterium]